MVEELSLSTTRMF